MTQKDFADIITLVRRAPLQNMQEAEIVAGLLKRFGQHVTEHFKRIEADANPDQ